VGAQERANGFDAPIVRRHEMRKGGICLRFDEELDRETRQYRRIKTASRLNAQVRVRHPLCGANVASPVD
jgi:hypothetical protein